MPLTLTPTSPGSLFLTAPYPLSAISIFNVKDYGAAGNGSTNDTAAIQSAINAGLAANGIVHFPTGTYVITAPLDIPLVGGWTIQGAGLGSIISQATANTPIFQFTHGDTHSWVVKDLLLTYAAQQTSAQTAGSAFYISGGVSVPEIYNWLIENVYFANCCDCFGGDETKSFSNWGGTMRHCFVSSTVTRSVIRVNPLVVVGHPNNRFEHIYVNASSMVGPLFYIQGGVSTSMSAIEINAASLGPTLIKDTAGGGWSVDAIRVEGGTYGAGASAVNAMFDMSASSLRIDRLELGPLTINSTGGGNNYIFDTSLSACHLGILTMNPAIITITGNWWLAQQATGTVTVDTLATNTFPTNFYLTNMPGTITAKQIQVLDWLKGAISADKGDANYTVALGDPNIITYATNLTAARTVTLPASSSAINSHLFDGLWYRVVRSGAGAFDLKINDATGATLLDSIVSGKTGAIEYTYRRGGWVQTLKAVA